MKERKVMLKQSCYITLVRRKKITNTEIITKLEMKKDTCNIKNRRKKDKLGNTNEK